MSEFLRFFLLPPGGLLVCLAVGLMLARRRSPAGWRLAVASALLLILASLPAVGSGLLRSLETYAALPAGTLPPSPARAVVVLSAESVKAPEYGAETAGPLTLVRLRYGAWLARRSGLPVLVTGGRYPGDVVPMGEQMRQLLEREDGLSDVWVEGKASDTWENGQFSAAILKAKGVDSIYLVTHAWHMPRAVLAFRQAGLTVVPAPTAFESGRAGFDFEDFLPSAKALMQTYYAVHEYAGLAAYSARGWLGQGTAQPGRSAMAEAAWERLKAMLR